MENVNGMKQTNGHLLRRARRLYWQHRGLLWAVYFVMGAIAYLQTVADTFMLTDTAVNSAVYTVYVVLIAPLSLLGVTYLLLRLFRGEPARFSMAFDFYKSPKTLLRALAAGAMAQFPMLLMNLAILLMGDVPDTATLEHLLLYLLAVIWAAVIWLWLMLKLFLLPYLYVDNPQERLLSLVKASFRGMHGKMWRTIGFSFRAAWWVLAAQLLVSAAFSFAVDPAWRASAAGRLVSGGVTQCLYALLAPCVQLALAGYAARLIGDMEEAGKRKGTPG